MPKITLIAGGARSGKSSFALKKLIEAPFEKFYLATCPQIDSEMNDRILKHKEERQGLGITTIEEELNIKQIFNKTEGIILMDCLTLWINNHLFHNPNLNESHVDEITRDAFNIQNSKLKEVIIVTNEVGQGLVPASPELRKYRDLLGRANQILGELSHEAYLVSCGLHLKLK